MTQETSVATPAETQTPAADTTNNLAPVDAGAPADAAPKGEPTEKPEKTAEQKELEYLRRKASKADRTNARMHHELESLRASAPAPSPSAQPDPVKLARQIATAERVAEKSNGIAKEGQKRFAATWSASLDTVIREAGPLIDNQTMLPTALGEAILDADDPTALLHYIGSDPSIADELSELSPTQLGRRIERLEAQMKARPEKPVSNAPPPARTLSGSGATPTDIAQMSQAQYEAKRKAEGARWAR